MERTLEDGMLNQEVDKLAGDVGIPAAADGVLNQEVDGNLAGGAENQRDERGQGQDEQGGSGGFERGVEDGVVNQEVNKVAGEFGVPAAVDGVLDQEVDREAGKFL